MGKSSSNDELTIRNQFDRICKLALKGEAADYYRHIAYRQKHVLEEFLKRTEKALGENSIEDQFLSFGRLFFLPWS